MTAARAGTAAAGDEALAIAHRTLVQGSVFLAASLQARAPGRGRGCDGLIGPGGARVIGNGLRELDRFLCLLLDAAQRRVAPPAFDHLAFVRRTNAANKLALFRAAAGLKVEDGDRLRAIGRIRACLHHCRGIVHDPALFQDLHLAAALAADTAPSDRRLQITFDQLSGICQFYRDHADVVMAACASEPRIP